MSDFEKRLAGFQLTTAEIIYQLPEHPNSLQTYVWQGLDVAPEYPVLSGFLDFWQRELDGPLHSVKIAACDAEAPAEVHLVQHDITLH